MTYKGEQIGMKEKKYLVKYYYLATGMEGVADERDLGEFWGEDEDHVKWLAMIHHFPDVNEGGSDYRFIYGCLSAENITLTGAGLRWHVRHSLTTPDGQIGGKPTQHVSTRTLQSWDVETKEWIDIPVFNENEVPNPWLEADSSESLFFSTEAPSTGRPPKPVSKVWPKSPERSVTPVEKEETWTCQFCSKEFPISVRAHYCPYPKRKTDVKIS